jgi:serine-type D-Ala-D-Ala carboxypeptidase
LELRRGESGEVGMAPERVRRVGRLGKGWVEQGVTPSLVLLAARKGVVVLHEAYGRLTPDPGSAAVELDALFPLASITKPITATSVMILVDDGLVGLNRPVAEYIPEFSGDGKEAVMVHHLLTHTAGIEDVDPNSLFERALPTEPAEEKPGHHPIIRDFLAHLYDLPLSRPPGMEMSYSDSGYELLGEIVCRVSGDSLAGFAQRRIFEPLGLNSTWYVVPDSEMHRVVRRPPGSWGWEIDTPTWLQTPWASAGVVSSARDLAIFCQMLLNRGAYSGERILSPAAVGEMTRNQVPGVPARIDDEVLPEASWSFGWGIRGEKQWCGSLYSPMAFEHSGAGGCTSGLTRCTRLLGCISPSFPCCWRAQDLGRIGALICLPTQ